VSDLSQLSVLTIHLLFSIYTFCSSERRSLSDCHSGFLTHKRAYELEETSKTASAADAKDDGNESSDCDEDDSEVPPLM